MILKKYSSIFKYNSLIFIIILLSAFAVIGLQNCISLRPQSVHQWAQCDRASVALNFGTKTLNIFKPVTHNTENGTGITGMEFPFVNYVVGILYRIFGFHESIYRLLMSFIVILGLLSAYEISKIFIQSSIFSGLTVLIFSFSPVLIFYTPNFLSDAASLGFILIGWYFFLKLLKNYNPKYIIFIFLFCTLAGMIKISSLISTITIILILILDKLSFFKNSNVSKLLIVGGNKLIAYLLISISIVGAWYYYANWLSVTYNSDVFLLKSKITFSLSEIKEHLVFISNLWWLQYYPKLVFYFIAGSTIFMIIFWKKAPRFLSAICIILWLGNLSFAFLMLSQFRDHDYYIITLLPVIIFHIILFVNVILNIFQNKKLIGQSILTIILAGLALDGLIICKDNFTERYNPYSWMSSNVKYKSYFDLEAHLNNSGIPLDAEIISIIDDSPNISLYLMNRQGKSVAGYETDEDIDNKINSVTDKPCYIIINDENYLTRNIRGIQGKQPDVTEGGLLIFKK